MLSGTVIPATALTGRSRRGYSSATCRCRPAAAAKPA